MKEGFLFGVFFVIFTIGISYVLGEIMDKRDEKQNRREE